MELNYNQIVIVLSDQC